MNICVENEPATLRSPTGSEEKVVYRLGVAGLLAVWLLFSVITALIVVALFQSGHLGLNHWLQTLSQAGLSDNSLFPAAQ